MNEREEWEHYRGYTLRVYTNNDAVYHWHCCAFPDEVTPQTPRSEHDIGQTIAEAIDKVRQKIDRQLAMGS